VSSIIYKNIDITFPTGKLIIIWIDDDDDWNHEDDDNGNNEDYDNGNDDDDADDGDHNHFDYIYIYFNNNNKNHDVYLIKKFDSWFIFIYFTNWISFLSVGS